MPVKVKQIMQEPAIVIGQDETIDRVARAMLEHQVTCVGVIDHEGRLVGVIREEEFGPKQRHLPFSLETAPQLFGEWITPDRVEEDYASGRTKTARQIMVPLEAAVISEDARLSEALPILEEGHSLLVARGERAVGMLTRHDLLKLVSPDDPTRVTD
jgi:CBS domain-containing protein